MTDYEKIYNFENLYRAYRKARQGKRWKGAAAKFEVNLLEALNLLRYQLQTKKYTLSPYNTFEVYEPKRRVVMSNAYKDKVVQHSLCDNVLEPILTRSFITDNYASQVGKGTHYGLDRLQEFLRRFYRKNGIDGWILKGDNGRYYEIIAAHTSNAVSYPVETTFAYYRLVELTHTGTIDDPIPYPETAGIVVNVQNGKYYSYKGKVYLAKANMPNCVYPPDTPSLWQWEEVTGREA